MYDSKFLSYISICMHIYVHMYVGIYICRHMCVIAFIYNIVMILFTHCLCKCIKLHSSVLTLCLVLNSLARFSKLMIFFIICNIQILLQHNRVYVSEYISSVYIHTCYMYELLNNFVLFSALCETEGTSLSSSKHSRLYTCIHTLLAHTVCIYMYIHTYMHMYV